MPNFLDITGNAGKYWKYRPPERRARSNRRLIPAIAERLTQRLRGQENGESGECRQVAKINEFVSRDGSLF